MEMKNTPSGAMTITVEQAHQKIMAAPEKMSLPLAQGGLCTEGRFCLWCERP